MGSSGKLAVCPGKFMLCQKIDAKSIKLRLHKKMGRFGSAGRLDAQVRHGTAAPVGYACGARSKFGGAAWKICGAIFDDIESINFHCNSKFQYQTPGKIIAACTALQAAYASCVRNQNAVAMAVLRGSCGGLCVLVPCRCSRKGPHNPVHCLISAISYKMGLLSHANVPAGLLLVRYQRV